MDSAKTVKIYAKNVKQAITDGARGVSIAKHPPVGQAGLRPSGVLRSIMVSFLG